MTEPILDLTPITDGTVSLLAGQPRGLAARDQLGVDALDDVSTVVRVIVPGSVSAITPSFVQGFFGNSAIKLKSKANVTRHYDVSNLPEGIKQDILVGLDRLFHENRLP